MSNGIALGGFARGYNNAQKIGIMKRQAASQERQLKMQEIQAQHEQLMKQRNATADLLKQYIESAGTLRSSAITAGQTPDPSKYVGVVDKTMAQLNNLNRMAGLPEMSPDFARQAFVSSYNAGLSYEEQRKRELQEKQEDTLAEGAASIAVDQSAIAAGTQRDPNLAPPANFQGGFTGFGPNGERIPLVFDPNTGTYKDPTTGAPMPAGFTAHKVSQQAVTTSDLLPKPEATKLRDAQISAQGFVDTAGDALKMLQDEPNINTFVARSASIINSMQQEAIAIAEQANIGFSEDISELLNPRKYIDDFDGLGIKNVEMRAMITSLAFQGAAASGQSGRDVSDKDVSRFIQEIGASTSDPRAFSKTLTNLANRTVRKFKNTYKVKKGEDFKGDLGLSALPKFSEEIKPEDLPGWDELSPEDQKELKERLSGN